MARTRKARVAVIGAGVGGIATAVKLKGSGFENFTVLERASGMGGVWRDNTYPGCEVDIHSHYYSFSFMPYDWTRSHATQPELLKYCEATVDHFGLRSHFRFNAGVQQAVWDEASRTYTLTLDDGSQEKFDAVITCVGTLNNPNYPKWDGIDTYDGTLFHTARWNADYDFTGKRVGYVGTGATSAQVVPSIAPDVEQLYVFQREPAWMVPKADADFTPEERAKYAKSRWFRMYKRYEWFRATSKMVRAQLGGNVKETDAIKQMALDHLEATIDDPELRKQLTPTYPMGCKRTVRDSQSNSYLKALNRDNVTLVPHAVERASRDGLIADGTKYQLDAIILGTGFTPQNYLPTISVTGRGGKSLHDTWAGTPRALVGSTVPGFPNFFMVYGPNSAGGGSIIYQNERSAEVAVRLIKRIKPGRRSVDTRPSVYRRYGQVLDRHLDEKLAVQLECNNYYFTASGRNVTQYPGTHLQWHMESLLWPLVGTTTKDPVHSS